MTMPRPRPEDVEWTRRAAAFYRRLGWNPLPSRMEGRKRPMLPHAQFWDTPVPDWVWSSPKMVTTNLQVMTGRRWSLAVVDLDGAAGAREWKRLRAGKANPPTWVSSRGPESYHLWYTLPAGVEGFPHRDLWKGEEGKHEGIELFCDQGLIVAPPSFHILTGERYAWLPGRGPRDLSRPADLPGWILDLPAVAGCPRAIPSVPARTRPAVALRRPTTTYSRASVDAVISGRYADIAAQFGLRLATSLPSRSGWLYCYRIHDAEDREPSASLSVVTGAYSENGGRPVSFYELLARLDPLTFPTWHAAVNLLGETYGAAHAKIA